VLCLVCCVLCAVCFGDAARELSSSSSNRAVGAGVLLAVCCGQAVCQGSEGAHIVNAENAAGGAFIQQQATAYGTMSSTALCRAVCFCFCACTCVTCVFCGHFCFAGGSGGL
jgi:hypothetical protein